MMGDHGFFEFKKRSGRKKQITPKVERKIIQKFRKMGHSRTVIGLSKKMHIGRESVRTIVIKNGYKWKKLRAKKLTEEQKSKRVDFCRTMLSDPSNIPFIIWTDETSFWLNKSKSGHGWVFRDGEDMDIESEAPINLNGPKVHV